MASRQATFAFFLSLGSQPTETEVAPTENNGQGATLIGSHLWLFGASSCHGPRAGTTTTSDPQPWKSSDQAGNDVGVGSLLTVPGISPKEPGDIKLTRGDGQGQAGTLHRAMRLRRLASLSGLCLGN